MTALERQRNILANALQGRLLMWILYFSKRLSASRYICKILVIAARSISSTCWVGSYLNMKKLWFGAIIVCLATDVFLLAHMFAKSTFHVKENYKLDPEHFDTQSGLELQAILKMPATELNYDMTYVWKGHPRW